MEIIYKNDANISVEAAIQLYRDSTLGERRPVDKPDVFKGMVENSDITISAWHGDKLVGISRTLTDYTYVAYLADLAVHADYQKQGIGKKLITETEKHLADGCMIVLLAAPKANDYYKKVGFEHNPRAWVLNRD